MIPLCRSAGIALTPYSPHARGFLAGNTQQSATTVRGSSDAMTKKWHLGTSTDDQVIAERVTEIARRLGVARATVALAWVLARPGITAPIIGASKAHHFDDALRALDLKLDAETMKYLEEPYRAKPVAEHE